MDGMERNIHGPRAPKSKAESWQLSCSLTFLFSNPVIKKGPIKSRFHQGAPPITATSDWCFCLVAPISTRAAFSKDLKTALSMFFDQATPEGCIKSILSYTYQEKEENHESTKAIRRPIIRHEHLIEVLFPLIVITKPVEKIQSDNYQDESSVATEC